MKSFEYDYYLDTPLNHEALKIIRIIGEYRGREVLYKNQTPEVLENLRKTAIIQSAESSNRIEGIEVAPGRIGRLLTLLLLYQAGFEVGRYISLERIIEESKETYYESLYKSSQGWHKGEHDLRPWWNYFQGMLTAAYNDFELRVGTFTKTQGAKREMVENTILRLPSHFRISDVQRACPTVSYPTLKRALSELSKKKKIRSMGKGRDAQWEQIRT